MYLIPIAWLYVTFMMAVAEATNSNGTVLGALLTFVLYGLLPIGLLLYFMGTPARKRARLAQEAREDLAAGQARTETLAQTQGQTETQAETSSDDGASSQPDTSGKAPADPVAPVRKEP